MGDLRITIVGKTGQICSDLQRGFGTFGNVQNIGRPELDLADLDAVRSILRSAKPDLLINAAAYTAVDQAESEPALAMRINGEAPAVMAEFMKKIGGLFIHYSTDYVFDGAKASPYVELDSAAPLNVYGASKLAGDHAVSSIGGNHLIFRTSWVYSAHGKNFLATILRLAESQEELRIVNDQTGSPTWSVDIAKATFNAVGQLLRLTQDRDYRLLPDARERSGIYHMSSAGQTTWFGYASAILEARRSWLGNDGKPVRIIPISSGEHVSAARRPINSVLCTRKLQETFGISLPEWRSSLARFFAELGKTSSD